MAFESVRQSSRVVEVSSCRRRKEIQRETPNVDTVEALKQTFKSLIDEGVEVDRLEEPEKRRQSRFHRENFDEKTN